MGTSVYVEIYVKREDVEKINKITDLLMGEKEYEESPEWLRFLIEQAPIRYVTDLLEKGKDIVFVGEHSNSHEFGNYCFHGDGEKTDEWECAYDNTSALCVNVLKPEEVEKAKRFAVTHKCLLDAAVKSIKESSTSRLRGSGLS